ncbi:MAG: helix-turn-helix domain-containing protein [Desulfobulbaceae bacterium]|nr:helix-turn-helix domain-containing protein [Desulfobulbaceae bacterium]
MDRMFLDVKGMAGKMGVSEKTIYRMLNDNQIAFAVKIGGQWRFRIDAVDGWLAAQSGGSAAGMVDLAVTVTSALERGAVFYRIHGENRDETIDELLASLPHTTTMDFTAIKLSVLAREAVASSSLKGVACMMPELERPVFQEKSLLILAFLDKPIDFKALDGRKTQAVFLLLAANAIEQAILDTRLRRLLMEAKFISELCKQPPRREVLQLLRDAEARLLPSRPWVERKEVDSPAVATLANASSRSK